MKPLRGFTCFALSSFLAIALATFAPRLQAGLHHSSIVLVPLFPDLTSVTATLYGCKNTIVAPEK